MQTTTIGSGSAWRKIRQVAAVGMVAALAALGAAAQEEKGTLRFEKTVAYRPGEAVRLDAKVGPVRVSSLKIEEGGTGRASVLGRLKTGASDTSTVLGISLDAENPQAEEWVVTYTLEFLDKKGQLIDRTSGKEGLEGEAATIDGSHAILSYVVPLIDEVRVKLEARFD